LGDQTRETVQYYSSFSRNYDSVRLDSHKGQLISRTQNYWFAKELKSRQPNNILEIGSGTGRLSLQVTKLSELLVATDASYSMIDILREKVEKKRITNIQFLICDAKHLPFRHETFDCVIGARVFWHLEDYLKGLRECISVLRPNGTFLFDFPSQISIFYLLHKRHSKDEVLTLFTNISRLRKSIRRIEMRTRIKVDYNTSPLLFIIPDALMRGGLRKIWEAWERISPKFFRSFNTYLLVRIDLIRKNSRGRRYGKGDLYFAVPSI